MDKIIAMYDIRGIQNYIYKTAKLSDAIGASSIVESIIEKTLEEAVDTYEGGTLSKDISWKDENGPLPYKETDADVQVLYIGGGNACVCYKNAEVCKTVNRKMSKLVLDKTYSLQLAIATTEKSENYANDYKKVMGNLIQAKDKMVTSMPLGALPIMDVEVKTGLPTCAISKASDPKYQGVSRETLLKRQQENRDRRGIDKRKKLLDSYVEEKGIDSTLGIVHIDGNNMGIRIRELIQEKESYEEAVNLIRKISYRIDDSYKKAFEKMRDKFNGLSADEEIVLKILTAGDDITYACRGKYALASVQYFMDLITAETMTGNPEDIDEYGFSVCAGIAYIGSHFPFSVGYTVAENCCESAKDEAKKTANMYEVGVSEDGHRKYKVGNWVDFQICKNVQSADLEQTREREYITSSGENLLLRPYEIKMADKEEKADELHRFNNLLRNLEAFAGNIDGIKAVPRSFLKELRNAYSEGEHSVKTLAAFLQSRGWKMPSNDYEMYTKDNRTALWYDSLEMLDLYKSSESVEKEVK